MEDPFYERNFRDYNFSKREFVLTRESVEYGDCARLQRDLEVRACYRNVYLGVEPDFTYLNVLVECPLRNEVVYPYRNRDMAAPELYAAKGMLSPQVDGGLIG